MGKVINRYRVWCITESAYVYEWAEVQPTDCPNNNTHTIDGAATTIVDTISDSIAYGDISVLNSTSTPLGISGVFTGTSEVVTEYSSITCTVYTDENSVANGLELQMSADGTNWDNVKLFTITGLANKTHYLNADNNFFRVIYTNGGTSQTLFRLQCVFHRFKSPISTGHLNELVSSNTSLINIKTTNDYETSVAIGCIDGHSIQLSAGGVSATTTEQTVWRKGGLYVFPTVGAQMTISSASANDTLAGTGAQIVLLEALDSSYNKVTEVMLMNGQTGVLTVSTDIFRINNVVVIQSGTLHTNDDDIHVGTGTVTAGVPAVTYGFIEIGKSVQETAVFTIPIATTALLKILNHSLEGNKTVVYKYYSRVNGTIYSGGQTVSAGGSQHIENAWSPSFGAGTDTWVNAEMATGTGLVNFSFNLLLITN